MNFTNVFFNIIYETQLDITSKGNKIDSQGVYLKIE